jgi:ParB-like chromosome segregation protein Spo0J
LPGGFVPELDSATDLKPPFTTFNREDGSEADPAKPEFREGLPKTYRPRHDLHYVEQLTATDAQPVRLVPVSRIDSGDLPPEHTVASLADSIAELGIVQPLLVRPHNGRFRLIAGRRRLAAARRAGLTEVPCLVHAVNETRASQLATADNLRPAQVASPLSLLASPPDVQADIDGHTAAMMSELQDAVASLQSCLPLLARATSTREQVALKLLTVESERAAWVIRARRYLAGTLPVAHTPVGGAALLDQVKRQAGMSMALRGGALQVDPVRSALVLHGDRTLLTAAVVGVAQALFALGELVQDPRVAVRLTGQSGGGPIALVITQPSAVLSDTALARFFEAGWTERPGGSSAELAILLARQAASLHRARLEVSSVAAAGTAVTITFEG